MTTFDWIVLAVVGLSALYAMLRGLTTELLSLGAWVGAVIALRFLFRPVADILRGGIESGALADLAALILTFGFSLICLRLVANLIGEKVKQSAIGPVDRALGASFGAVRGLLLVGLGFLGLSFFINRADPPAWLSGSKTFPVVDRTSTLLAGWIQAARERNAPRQAMGPEEGYDPHEGLDLAPGEAGDGYSREQRKALEDLIEQERKRSGETKI